LLSGIDAFVFPSLYEGLGLVLLEAQASGVPVTMSATVPTEVVVIPELVRSLSLDATMDEWVSTILRVTRRVPQSAARSMFLSSPFNVTNSARELLAFYRACLEGPHTA
jgi:glycosyltransferase EpsF